MNPIDSNLGSRNATTTETPPIPIFIGFSSIGATLACIADQRSWES
jgi:hypothetical protein